MGNHLPRMDTETAFNLEGIASQMTERIQKVTPHLVTASSTSSTCTRQKYGQLEARPTSSIGFGWYKEKLERETIQSSKRGQGAQRWLFWGTLHILYLGILDIKLEHQQELSRRSASMIRLHVLPEQ